MEKYNFFNYVFLLTPLAVFVFFVAKILTGFFNYFIKPIRSRATVLQVGKRDNAFGPFCYFIGYDMNGAIIKSTLKGFYTPYYYKVGEAVDVLINKKNPAQAITLNPRGQVAKILNLIIVVILVILGAVHSLQIMNILPDVPILYFVPFLFLAMSVIMSINILYSKYLLRDKSKITEGTIVDMKQVLDNEHARAYRPVIEYVVNGKIYRSAPETWYYSRERIGEMISVIFLVDMPEFGEINSFGYNWVNLIFWFTIFLNALFVLLLMY